MGQYRPAAASEKEDVPEASLVQYVLGVGEHLHGPPLVGGDGDSVRILLDGRPSDLVSAPVVTEVYDLAALALEYPPEDADGRVMAIEDGRRSDYPEWHTVG